MDIWDRNFLEMTILLSDGSKCAAKHVGALIVKNNSIISSGVNGTPSGYQNCCEKFYKDKDTGDWFMIGDKGGMLPVSSNMHNHWSKEHEIHAEMNALIKASKNGINIDGSTIYVNYSPCMQCAKSLIVGGIKRVVFREDYDDVERVSEFLGDNNVTLTKIKWKRSC